jgi:hypothetical protein
VRREAVTGCFVITGYDADTGKTMVVSRNHVGGTYIVVQQNGVEVILPTQRQYVPGPFVEYEGSDPFTFGSEEYAEAVLLGISIPKEGDDYIKNLNLTIRRYDLPYGVKPDC